MKRSYTIILIFLFVSKIDCNNIQIAKFIPTYGSNTDLMVSEITSIVTAIENTGFEKAILIQIILSKVDDRTIMPQIMEKTVQKLSSIWLVTTNDCFCCDSYEPRVILPQKPMVIEHAPDVYIIPLRQYNGLNYLEAQLNLMSEENSFNPQAIFVLITLTQRCGDLEGNSIIANSYFDLTWSKNCMSSMVLVLSECDNQTTIITATPFSDRNVCRKVQGNGTKQYHSNWSEQYLVSNIYKNDHKNFNKCTFSVGTIPTPPNVVGKLYTNANKTHYEFVGGTDLELLNLVSTIYNFTYEFDLHHGYDLEAMARTLPNGSIVGFFVDILRNNLDMSVGCIIPYNFNFFRYHYTSHFKYSSFGWAVADANPIPHWKIFLGGFSQDVWIIFCFVFIITSLLYFFLDLFLMNCSIKNVNVIYNFHKMPLIQYFSIALSLASILKPKSPCLRVLHFSWSIYSLHMCIAYSSMLFLLMSNPPLEKKIETFENLKSSGLKVGSVLIVFRRFLFVELDNKTRDILKDSFVCPTWESCIEDFVKHRNFSLLIMQDKLEYYLNIKQSKIHRISEAFFSYGNSVMISRGNPLIPGFNKIITLAVQSGLTKKWDRDTKSKESVNVNESSKDEKSATILIVRDLKGAFFVLMVGICISSLSFYGELVISFLQKYTS